MIYFCIWLLIHLLFIFYSSHSLLKQEERTPTPPFPCRRRCRESCWPSEVHKDPCGRSPSAVLSPCSLSGAIPRSW